MRKLVCECGRVIDLENLKWKKASAHVCQCGQTFVLNDKTGQYEPYIKFEAQMRHNYG